MIMNYEKQIMEMVENLGKNQFISEFRKNTSYELGSNSFHLPGYERCPDRIKFHSFKEMVKGECRTTIEVTCNPFRLFSRTILYRSFREDDYEGMFEWYRDGLERILKECEEVMAFLEQHKDVGMFQKSISRYLFKIGDIEIYFGRFFIVKGMRRPLKAYMGNEGWLSDMVDAPVSAGIIHIFKKAVKKTGQKYFMELPSSLRDMMLEEP